jgi:hypothetical protein
MSICAQFVSQRANRNSQEFGRMRAVPATLFKRLKNVLAFELSQRFSLLKYVHSSHLKLEAFIIRRMMLIRFDCKDSS